jgi:hypothetical protein
VVEFASGSACSPGGVILHLRHDLDAIRSFAGADHEAAVVAEEAREVLVRFDERVSHYQVVVDA